MANRNPFLESSFDEIAADLTPVEQPKTANLSPARSSRGFAPTRDDLIQRATELDIDPKLALAMFGQESSGNWDSKDSPKGARGGMQVMPGTYKMMMGTSEGQRDPWNNMEAGLRYLRYGQDTLRTRDPRLLAAGYHAGYDRPELKKGVIPNTDDGMIATSDYADSIVARVNGTDPQKTAAPGKSRTMIGKPRADFADLEPITDEKELAQLPKAEPQFDFSGLKPITDQTELAEIMGEPKKRDWTDEYITDPLKRGAKGVQQGLTTNATNFNAKQIEVIGRIDRGEDVPDIEDAAGYKYMNAQQRAEYKKTMGVAFNSGVQRITEIQKEIEAIPQDPIVAKASQAKSFNEWWTYFKQAPFKFIAQTGVESLPAMAPGLVAGGVMGLATRSVAAGSAMLGAGSYAVDYPATVLSALQDAGVDTKNPDALAKAFSDPKLMENVRKQAASHALAVGTLDAVSGGRASATLVPGKGVVRGGANLAAKTVEQGVLGATGEAAGQVAQGKQELEWGPVMSEFAGELAGAPVEIAGAGYVKGKEMIAAGTKPEVPVTEDLKRIEPTMNEPSQASGPIARATENAAVQPDRVTVDTPAGAVSGTVTGKAQDGTTQITGDDGQVYTFKVGENGITMTPDAPNTPLSNALEVAAGDVPTADSGSGINPSAPDVIDPITGETIPATDPRYRSVVEAKGSAASPEARAAVEAANVAAKPAELDLTTMDEPALRERLKYVAGQAKNSGWDKRLMAERQRIEAEINARQKAAAPELPMEQPAVKVTSKSVDQLTDDEWTAIIGSIEGQARPNAKNDEISIEDVKLLKKMIIKAIKDGVAAGKTSAQIVDQIEALTKGGIRQNGIDRIYKLLDAQPAQAAAQIDAKSAQTVALPKDLAGAKPRYNYGKKSFELKFESDIDRAAFIAAQDKPSKRDADYIGFAMAATGMSEAEVRAHGRAVRDAIKAQAKDAKPGTLKVPTVARGENATVPVQQSPQQPVSGGVPAAAGAATSVPAAPAAAESESGAENAGGASSAPEQPAKLKTASKEDVEHLFGIDKKRATALERIAKGTAYFGTKEKAQEFIKKNGLKDTHEVVQTGKVRFEVKAKGQTDGNDNRAAGERDGAEAVGEKANAGQGAAAPVQSDAGEEKAGREVRAKQLRDADDWWTGANRNERAALIREKYGDTIADTNSRLEWNEMGEGMRERVADILAEKAAPQVGEALPNATAPEQVRGVDDRELGEIVSEFKGYQQSMIEDGEKISHVFDAPKKAEIVRLNDKVKVYTKDKGWMTPAEAKAEIAKWKEHAQEQYDNDATRSANSQKVVLSLFDLSGEWSKPWEEAGYQVYRFDIQADPDVGDVNNFSTGFFGDWFGDFEGQDIYAILAACPCTDFASSGARHFAAKDADGRTVASVKLVHQTLATIEYFKPAVWAIENPVGRIEDLGGLPPWRLSFDPNHIGDPYTKKTLLWGRFNADLPVAPVEPTEGSKMHRMYGGKSLATKNARSVTPEGFSYGFFMANNAADHPAMAIANKYDRLNRKIIERAVKAGVTEQQISEAVEDFYYMDLDDEAANRAILDLIDQQKAEPAAVDGEAWWKSLTPNARREAMDAAGVNLPDRVLWNYIKPAMQEKLLAVMNGQNDELDAEMRSYERKAEAAQQKVTAAPAEADDRLTEVRITRRANPGNMGDRSFVARAFIKSNDMAVEGVGATKEEALTELSKDADRKLAAEPAVSPLTQARNDLIDLNTQVEQQGRVVDDRLLERVRRQEKLIADLESEQNLAETPDASAELMDRIVKAYGYTEQGEMPAGIAKTATKLRDALIQRDRGMLEQILHPSNPNSRKAFEALFAGKMTLPKGVAGTNQVIAGFLGQVNEQIATEAAPAPAAPAAQFAGNKIFTQDAVDRARARLKSKLSQLNSGIDPEMMIDGMTIAGAYIEAGVREFSAYASAMVEDFGDRIKPYLLSFYEGARNYPGIDTEGMTAQDEAKKLADALTAQPAKEKDNEPEALDQPGARALEGAPTDLLSGLEPDGQAGRGAARGGRSDASGNERARGRRVQQSGSVGNDAGEVPVPAGRAGEGRGGKPGRRTVQRGERATERDPAIDAGGSDLLTPADGQRAQDRASDFQITAQDEIGEGGAKTKFRNNMAAIRLLKELQEANRPATREEQAVLAKYVGWGGLPQAFYRDNNEVTKGWEKEAAELKEALTEDELAAAASSTRNAHYTSPEIVTGMWDAIRHFGYQGGRVLEPSVGVGNFFGLMPKDLRAASALNGVELDRITGGIAQKLYPQANVAAPVGFQDYSAPDNYFDLAIGNPPFGREGIYDAARRKISGFSIHNYFFAKSIDTVKPNGVLAMVVTNRLLDSAGDKARQYIADRAEFLGAIRLPNNAFLKNAGTEVTTDIIFLRKLRDGEQATGERWMDVKTIKDANGKDVPLNEYFVRNPDMMLGEFGAFGSMYSPDEPALIAREGQDTAALLQAAIKKLPAGFMDAPTAEPTRETITPTRDISAVKVGSVFEQGGEVFERREDMLNQQQAAPITFASEKAKERVLGMIGVRDALVQVRALQLSDTATDAQIEAARAELNRVYDAFVKANGPLNTDANKRLMRDDPSWPQIAALEDNFDKGISPAVAKSTGEKPRAPSAKKAAIFTKRTQAPYHAPEKASSAKDALVSSLAERGRVDLDYMASLYGKTPDAIVKELGDLVFRNPVGGWETREQYLSGNVKQKLAQALEAAKTDSAMNANVEALRAVQPADIEAVDIDVKAGAHWIPVDVMQDFVRTISEAGKVNALYNPINAQWTLTAESMPASAQTQWGTDRVRAINVLEAAANQKQIQVYDQHPDGSRTLNERETTAANEKVERVKAEWRRWIWDDDARRERLARIYNDTFNTDVSRDYDGSHLTFPGKVGNDIIALRPHQANAIWRIVQSGTTLLDHVVGAGKTFTMIGGIMELRRMGLAKKPVLVVPNHLVGQWAEDFMKLYPGANILAATKRDFEKENRKKLFARIATGDWDAVIVAHSSFGKVEVEPEFQEQFIKQQIADMDTSIAAMRAAEGKGSRNVKQIEKQKAALEEKLKRLFDTGSKDDNLYFSELGIDAVFVDEAHEFKNLGFSTGMQRVAGLGNPTGSNKAADLFMKVRAILKRTNGRNVVFATGTPISNTMAEMYTMQRYLDYETLQAQGIAHFDAWAKTFGEVVTDWELSPSGQYKMNSRFAKFVNMPELMQRYQSFADVINRDDINRQLAAQGKKLPVPKIKGGKPQNVVVPRSNDQAQYIGVPMTYDDGREVYPEGSLIWRSENLPKKAEKGADNMLKIMSDARKAALDMRLIDPSYPDNPDSKVNVAADNIKATYDQWEKDKGAQLVFIDLSTPKGAVAKEAARIQELMKAAEEGDEAAQEKLDAMSPDELMALESGKFSVYDDLKEKLIARGIPEREIAFIHDANTEQQKEDLFGKVRSGRIRVLFGSTAKMGAGMNVQERLVALHHLDAPWRPSDLEQREGRIIRQGNKLYEADPGNFEVQILRYATKQTLDSRMWQTIEAKARFIEQVRKGAGSREVEDVAGEAANSAEMKAASSGNPLILEEMTLRQQIRKLENQKAEHDREQYRIRDRIRMLESLSDKQDRDAAVMDKDAKRVPEKFEAKIGKETFDKHGEAGEAILAAVDAMFAAGADSREIGSYGGFTLEVADATRAGGEKNAVLTIRGDAEYQIEAKPGSNAAGLALRLQNTVKGLSEDAAKARTNATKNRADIPKLEGQMKPWGQDQELADAKARHAAVIDQLRPKKKEQPAAEGEKPAMSRGNDQAALEAIFEGLEKRGKARESAVLEAEKRFDSDTISYIESNFWNILGELEDSGRVEINC